MSLPLFDRTVNEARDTAMGVVGAHAEERHAGFAVAAEAFVLNYLRSGAASSEALTLACKAAGIVPHDDRAFGPVYMRLARRRQIVKVDSCRRERGHGTAGGNVWGLVGGITDARI